MPRFPDDNPRRHYYAFAHRVLPQTLFSNVEAFRAAALAGGADGGLQKLWASVANHDGMPADATLTIRSRLHECEGRSVILITPPSPEHVTEAHYIAVVLDQKDSSFLRYFVLEHSWDVTGAPRTVLAEWTSEGRHVNFGDGPEPSEEAFVAAVCQKVAGA